MHTDEVSWRGRGEAALRGRRAATCRSSQFHRDVAHWEIKLAAVEAVMKTRVAVGEDDGCGGVRRDVELQHT